MTLLGNQICKSTVADPKEDPGVQRNPPPSLPITMHFCSYSNMKCNCNLQAIVGAMYSNKSDAELFRVACHDKSIVVMKESEFVVCCL